MKYKRIFLIVMDSLGIGYDDTSYLYDDLYADTLGHINEYQKLEIKTLKKLGIGYIKNGIDKNGLLGIVTRLKEVSNGKDTLTGHLELMGLKTINPFKTFEKFPKELINELKCYSKREILGNKIASGTEIIKELGEESIKKAGIIVYTSADSVLQIAANEDIIPLGELYDICKYAGKITLKDEWKVGRIIARPFVGTNKNNFKRTSNRHDYALNPNGKTALNYLDEANFDVISVGKINDIFNGSGINKHYPSKSNDDGISITIDLLDLNFTGLCFTNLVDFDSLYGHRRDVKGYHDAIEKFDKKLAIFINKMNDDDLLMICADHGNDPTFKGTDHTKEYVPLIIYNKNLKGMKIDDRIGFYDVGKTILENFDIKNDLLGKSIL